MSHPDAKWLEPPGRLTLRPASLHIWRVPLGLGPTQAAKLFNYVLDTGEQNRARRFVHEHHRQRFIASRSALRMLLASYLSTTPRSIEFCYTASGKPFLSASSLALQFSLSHSEDLALFSFSLCGATGVDIERVDDGLDVGAIGPRVLTPSERKTMLGLSQQAMVSFFFSCWTRKEAQLKMTGEGLTADCRIVEAFPHAFANEGNDAPHLQSLDMSARFMAAVACRHTPVAISCWNGSRVLAPTEPRFGCTYMGSEEPRDDCLVQER